MFIQMSDSQRAMVRSYGTLAARILMGALFVLAGLGKTGAQFAGTVGYIAGAGLPMPELLAILTIIVEIGGGLMIILGYRIGTAAIALIGFTLLASWFFHNPKTWEGNVSQQIMFMKNLAICGGLLYMLAYGPGTGPSLQKKCAPKEASGATA